MPENYETLREKLANAGDRHAAAALKKSLRSNLAFHGVRRPALNKILAEFALGYRDLISLTPVNPLLVTLWKSNSFEERVLALRFLLAFKGLLGEREWGLLSDWTDSSENWSLSDLLSSVRAWLLRRYPERFTVLAGWATSENVWRRRSAVVSLLIVDPEEKEKPQLAIPVRAALKVVEAAINDTDPIVQKANAWITREIAREAPEHASRLLDQYKWKAPKAFLTDAADGLPERLRKELLIAMAKPPEERPAPVKKPGKKAASKKLPELGVLPMNAGAGKIVPTAKVPVTGKMVPPAKLPGTGKVVPPAKVLASAKGAARPEAPTPAKGGGRAEAPPAPAAQPPKKPAKTPAPHAPPKPKPAGKAVKSPRPTPRPSALPASHSRPSKDRMAGRRPPKTAKKAAAGAGPRRPSRAAGRGSKPSAGKSAKHRRGGSARRG